MVDNKPTPPSTRVTNEATKLVVGPDGFPDLGERFKVEGVLGSGGMGTVYKVRDTALDKEFAVKVLNESLVQDKLSVKRFEQEAHAASNLTHANLAAVYEYGVSQAGAPFIVMDYLDGKTLEQILKAEGYLDVPRALDIFIQTVEAVAHAHLKGVIHRDIKPSNIIIEEGEHKIEHVKVLDFGIAKVLPSSQKAAEALTQTGDIFGSPLYMSPEQCQGNMQDVRSDIYSLGCVMYESLTGKSPFAAENAIKIILRHVKGDSQSMSVTNREAAVPPDLENVVMRCLALDPKDRYQTANDLLYDLRRARDGKRVKPVHKRKPPTELNKTLVAAIASAALIALGASMYIFIRPTATPTGPADPLGDAQNFDSKSYSYFISKQYTKALPLLQFGVSEYEEKLAADQKKGDQRAALQDETWLAENWQHIGKCYLQIAKDAAAAEKPATTEENLVKAAEAYKNAQPFYEQHGNWPGGSTPEFVRDYAETLRLMKDDAELTKLKAFAQQWNVPI